MIDTAKPLEFFLGANTPQGFVSRFDQLADPADGWREFVIKGGPGTGKSTLMKRIAAEVGTRGGQVELIHCASDVDALDAVIFPAIKTAIADGTAPHGGAHNSINFIGKSNEQFRAGSAAAHWFFRLRDALSICEAYDLFRDALQQVMEGELEEQLGQEKSERLSESGENAL